MRRPTRPTRPTRAPRLARAAHLVPVVVPVVVLAVAGLAACSTGAADGAVTEAVEPTSEVDADAFPVTIEHALGETTIEQEPTRVVAVGYAEADFVLSLGVVPVGAAAITYAGNENESSDFFDEALAGIDGAEQPVRLDETDGVPVDKIVRLEPDLVTATASGITQEEHDRLTGAGIPVVAYPEAPYTTTWQESLDLVGRALGRSELADQVEAETEQLFADTAAEHPELEGASFVFGGPDAGDGSSFYVYTPEDNRPRLLAELGMVNTDFVEQNSEEGQFLFNVSSERAAALDADVFLTYATSEQEVDDLADNPLTRQVPAIADGRWYATVEPTEAVGFSAPSPLSLPSALEEYVPHVAAALEGDGSGS